MTLHPVVCGLAGICVSLKVCSSMVQQQQKIAAVLLPAPYSLASGKQVVLARRGWRMETVRAQAC